MSCKLLLVFTTVICVFASLEAASLRGILDESNAVVQGVEANVRSARQNYPENYSAEYSDEDDEENDADLQHLATIRRQQAYEQSVDNSQEGSDEDNEDNFDEDDDDDNFSRRLKRESNNEIKDNSLQAVESGNQNKQPALETSSASSTTPSATDTSNTSVLILIRDAIKKVTELPNSQQVATSAQQYFQMFEHFLQQTIEQVINDVDDEDESESESTTIAAETETATEVSEQSEKQPLNETSDKDNSNELESAQPEKKPEAVDEVKA